MGSEHTSYVESEPSLFRHAQGKLFCAGLTTFNKIAKLTRRGLIRKIPELEAKELLNIEQQLSVRDLQFRKPRNPKSEAIGMEHGVCTAVLTALWEMKVYTWRDLTQVTRFKFFRGLQGAIGDRNLQVKKLLIARLTENGWSLKKDKKASIGDYPFSEEFLLELENEGICTLPDLKRSYGRRTGYFIGRTGCSKKLKEIAYVLAMHEQQKRMKKKGL